MILRNNQDLFNTIKALSGVNDFTTEETANLVDLANRRLTMAYNTSPMWQRYVQIAEQRTVSTIRYINRQSSDSSNQFDVLFAKTGTASIALNLDKGIDVFISNDRPREYETSKNIWALFRVNNSWVLSFNPTFSVDPITNIVTFTQYGSISSIQNTDDETVYSNPTNVISWTVSDGSFSPSSSNIDSGAEITSVSTIPFNGVRFPFINSEVVPTPIEPVVEDFIRIHRDQSFLVQSSTEFDFYVDDRGAQILNAPGVETAYVTYKKPILDQTTGVVISSLTSGKQIPNEFFNYTAHAVYADFLRMDGQHDKAAFEEQKADLFLATELERIDIINNNNSLNHKISTYVNRSTR